MDRIYHDYRRRLHQPAHFSFCRIRMAGRDSGLFFINRLLPAFPVVWIGRYGDLPRTRFILRRTPCFSSPGLFLCQIDSLYLPSWKAHSGNLSNSPTYFPWWHLSLSPSCPHPDLMVCIFAEMFDQNPVSTHAGFFLLPVPGLTRTHAAVWGDVSASSRRMQ